MKLFAATSLLLGGALCLSAEYKASDRANLVRHLETSRSIVAVALEGMTAEQSNFKPDSKVWSPTEIVEHLVLIEDFLVGILNQAIEKGKPVPDTEKLPDPSELDAAILRSVPDRTQKAQAPEQGIPKGNYRHWEEAFTEFSARRIKTIEFVQKTKVDLRRYRLETPMGPMDGHQWLLFLAAHTERHQNQIAEARGHEL
ncbi:MAG: DinB family protein, partial [Bryobacterales bacterium]|nr:DinB family protein [Bryobacterales bacterium]